MELFSIFLNFYYVKRAEKTPLLPDSDRFGSKFSFFVSVTLLGNVLSWFQPLICPRKKYRKQNMTIFEAENDSTAVFTIVKPYVKIETLVANNLIQGVLL